MNKCLIVLGMHRSGTSALTAVLAMMGAEPGSRLLGPSEENAKGYWEHSEIVAIHEELLKALGSSWDDAREYPDGWNQSPVVVPYKEKLKKVVLRDFDQASLWIVKDPRVCRLLPLWLEIFEEINVQPHFIFMLRYPFEVVSSLISRNGIHATQAYMLWLRYLYDSEKWSRGYLRTCLTYEQILDNWQAAVERITQAVELDWAIDDKKTEAIKAFLDPALRHHRARKNPAKSNLLENTASQIYRELSQASGEEFNLVLAKFQKTVDDLHGLLDQPNLILHELSVANSRLESEIDRVKSTVSWRITKPLRFLANMNLRIRQHGSLDTATTVKIKHAHQLRPSEYMYSKQDANPYHINSFREELRLAEIRLYKFAHLQNIWRSEHSFLAKVKSISSILTSTLVPDVVKWMLKPLIKQLRCLPARMSAGAPSAYRASIPIAAEQQKRVLHVIANFMVGGSSQLVVDLMEGLGAAYKQQVITSFIPCPPAYTNIPIHECRGEPELNACIARFKPDLVHVHYWGDANWAWYDKVFRILEGLECRVIENINTPVIPYRSNVVSKYIYVSQYVRDNFGDADGQSIVVYPGTNTRFYSPVGTRKRNGNCIGMVYRLEPDKLQDKSIDVFIEVARRRPGTNVLIVGDGSLLAGFRRKVSANRLENAFSFVGTKSYYELPSLFSQMDMFVAPVWNESFGQVSCFAMSMGIPVVGYKVGGLQEIIENTALLVSPDDSDALATLIIDLLDDPDRRELIGRENRQRAETLFSVEGMVGKYAAVYEELMAGA